MRFAVLSAVLLVDTSFAFSRSRSWSPHVACRTGKAVTLEAENDPFEGLSKLERLARQRDFQREKTVSDKNNGGFDDRGSLVDGGTPATPTRPALPASTSLQSSAALIERCASTRTRVCFVACLPSCLLSCLLPCPHIQGVASARYEDHWSGLLEQELYKTIGDVAARLRNWPVRLFPHQ